MLIQDQNSVLLKRITDLETEIKRLQVFQPSTQIFVNNSLDQELKEAPTMAELMGHHGHQTIKRIHDSSVASLDSVRISESSSMSDSLQKAQALIKEIVSGRAHYSRSNVNGSTIINRDPPIRYSKNLRSNKSGADFRSFTVEFEQAGDDD